MEAFLCSTMAINRIICLRSLMRLTKLLGRFTEVKKQIKASMVCLDKQQHDMISKNAHSGEIYFLNQESLSQLLLLEADDGCNKIT